ncbi:protein FAM114A2 [Harmonia axyridis]|uniref:protein FAM114A2 n=1 Tax=Harmonia axyridis TaxID=115357 RepID=UPI001E276998|nr:protein FAM114A2 [Harmonia axyridis]
MDNSDSEYFESADEDIQTDEEVKEKKHEIKIIGNKESNDKVLKGEDEKLNLKSSSKFNQSQNIDKSDASWEIPKIVDCMKIKNKEIDTHDSLSHKQKSEDLSLSNVKNVNIDSHSSTSSHIQKFEATDIFNHEAEHSSGNSNDKPIEKSRNKETKSNEVNIKPKLGNKITKKLVEFEASPEKKVSKAVENPKEDCEVKKMVVATENLQIEEENLWGDDELDWEAEAKVDSKNEFHQSPSVDNASKRLGEEKHNNESDSWSSWSNWGVSVLSSATQSVSSITNQITNVIESGIGAVDPEELARIEREEKRNRDQRNNTENFAGNKGEQENASTENSYGSFGLGNLVKLVENTGTKVISGGLDTLESIGKKTMEVLQEGDPGLKKKRAFLKIDQEKPVLSQILREAKERAENGQKTSEQTSIKKWKNYETLFDDHHGLVHLEALELLSKQCEIKLKNIQSSMSGDEFTEFSETMDQIKELCELPDEEEEEQISIEEIKDKLRKAVAELGIQINYDKLVTNWEETEIWLGTLDLEVCDEKEVHQQAIETLAEMTSTAMEQFHKAGELLLIKDRRSTAAEADCLVQITATLISLIGIVAAKFCEKLNGKVANNKEVSGLITNVFFEAANSSSYIQDALQILIPVLQVGAI